MKFKILVIAILSILLLTFIHLFAGTNEKHPDVDFSISCQECHAEATPEAFSDWKNSKHGVMDYGCYICHGDGKEEFHVKPGTERCVGCHSPQEVDFSQIAVDNCFDCHKGHTLKFHEK